MQNKSLSDFITCGLDKRIYNQFKDNQLSHNFRNKKNHK